MSTDDNTTQPTIMTILERINALTADVAGLRAEIAGLRADIVGGLRQVERKIDLINKDFLSIRADQMGISERVEELEKKVS